MRRPQSKSSDRTEIARAGMSARRKAVGFFTPRSAQHRAKRPLQLEPLETRVLMSVTAEVDKVALFAQQDQLAPLGQAMMVASPLQGDQASMDHYRLGFDASRLDVLGFDGQITVGEGTPLGDATPTGQSYMLYDHWGGAWCDAEKSPSNSQDDLMCWAATASNVLDWTGWGDIGGMTTSDQMFAYFQNHWTDEGGLMGFGWDWWFDGTNDSQGWSGWSQEDVQGGGFYPSESINTYYHSSSGASTALATIDSYLHAGYGVGLGIYTDSGGGHAITCWGYNYNPSNPSDYNGIWVSDSDDSKSSSSPPNLLRYYEVENISGRWYLQNFYGYDDWYIDLVEGLAPRESTPEPPEPPPPADGRIRGTVWNDANGNGARDTGETGRSSQRVYLDVNRNGRLDSKTSHKSASGLPKAITDGHTTSSTLTLSGAYSQLADINITLKLKHTYVSDLDIYLVSPSGTQVLLCGAVGGSGDNFTKTKFDDEATRSILSGVAPFSGSFRPEGLLSDFDGEDPNGVWTLRVTDNYTYDQGSLKSWSIDVSSAEPYVRTNSQGAFTFTDVAPGTYRVRHDAPSGWTQTSPTAGYRSATITDGNSVSGLNFGETVGRWVRFNSSSILSYGGSKEDRTGRVTVEDGGAALHLSGNRWKAVKLPYTVTANTVVEFDFQSDSQGDIHGIGLDTNKKLDTGKTFELYGAEAFSIQAHANYDTSAPGVKHYTIPVGHFYTGKMKYLFFANDHDVSVPNGEGVFSNVHIYESNLQGVHSVEAPRVQTSAADVAAFVETLARLAIGHSQATMAASPSLEAALLVEGVPVRAVDAVFSGIPGDLAALARACALTDDDLLAGSPLARPLSLAPQDHESSGVTADEAMNVGSLSGADGQTWIPAGLLDLKPEAALAG